MTEADRDITGAADPIDVGTATVVSEHSARKHPMGKARAPQASHPVVRGVAGARESLSHSGTGGAAADSGAVTHPLSMAQSRWWVAQQLAERIPLTVAMYLDLAGCLDVALLTESARKAARELESPQLRFTVVDGQPRQFVDVGAELPVQVVDLSAKSDPPAAAMARMYADYSAPLDPCAAALTTVTVFRIAAQHHLLYLRSHHMVLDGVGAANVLRRTGVHYRAAVARAHRGRSVPTGRVLWRSADHVKSAARKPGPLSISEIIEDENAYRTGTRAASDRAYWLDQRGAARAPAALGGTPSPPSPANHRVTGTLDVAAVSALHAAQDRYGATFPELTIAAFACYLARMSERDSVGLSLPVTGRTTAALRNSAGSMSNVVPLRLTDLRNSAVGAVVAQVRAKVIGALRHQRYPYEEIQRDRGNHTSRGAFGPVLNVLGFVEPFRLGALVGQAELLSLGPVEDLLINGYQAGSDQNSVSIDFHGNPARYRRDVLVWQHGAFLEYFGRFLRAAADQPVAAVELPSSREARTVARPDGRTMPELLSSAVSRVTRETVALSAGARAMTYRELDRSAARWARELIAQGAGPGAFVVVAVPRSLESVLALWAVSKTGAVFVPVDASEPVGRIAGIIADSGARLGLTVQSWRNMLPGNNTQKVGDTPQELNWLVLDDAATAERVAARPGTEVSDAERPRSLTVDQPAYLIYTSGSTGAPKGVVVTHRGLGAMTDYLVEHYGVHRDSVVLHAHAPSFDAHLLELLSAFASGARLVVAPADIVAGPQLAALIAAEQCTHFFTTPAVLAGLAPSDVPSLRVVVVGGEACPGELLATWAPVVRLHNGYGPTETTVMATQTAAMSAEQPVDIGAPLPGVTTLTLDSCLRPVPQGARGELYLGGNGVAQGYRNDPGRTAARFIADPHGDGDRLYRTGDLVVAAPDGRFEFLGRTDGQQRLRGRRVELAEIEAALLALPQVAHAVVTIADSGNSRARAIGYIVVAEGHSFDPRATIAALRAALPAAMVPANVIEIDRVPVTAHGKLDRGALPIPTHRMPYRAPRTATQRLVAATFATVAAQQRVGVDDDFFELGGNSLSGVTVSSTLAQASGAPVTVRWLYTAPTVRELAELIEASAASDELSATPDRAAMAPLLTLRRNGTREPLFCLHSAVPLSWCYAGLARYVGDRPVYGVQAPHLTSENPSVAVDIDRVADSYVEVIRARQPAGPYHLLGWSLGGQLAHAIAIRLRARGARVALLAMLDSVVVPETADPPPVPRMRDLVTHLLGDEPDDAEQARIDRLPDLTPAQAEAHLAGGASFGTGLTADQLARLHRGYIEGVATAHRYRPGVFDGDLLYFSATQGMTAPLGAQMWRPFVTGQLIEHPVRATHAQLTNTEVLTKIGPVLAQHLQSLPTIAADPDNAHP